MPYIIDEVEEKIQTALGMGHLYYLKVSGLDCKSWVANEFLDVLTCYDLAEHGLDKLIFNGFDKKCEPFEEEVLSRLANMCTRLCHLELTAMFYLTETGRLSMVSLFRQITQHNPPIQVLSMGRFSVSYDKVENIG